MVVIARIGLHLCRNSRIEQREREPCATDKILGVSGRPNASQNHGTIVQRWNPETYKTMS